MSRKITSGRASVEIDQDLQSFYSGFLDKVAPNAKKVIVDTLEEIEKEAAKQWPVRKPSIRKDAQGNILFFRKTSKESWRKFERGFRILPDGSFEGYLRNTADYSWAMKFGVDSVNNRGQEIIQPQGKRVAQELLVKPQNQKANSVVKALANDLMKRV